MGGAYVGGWQSRKAATEAERHRQVFARDQDRQNTSADRLRAARLVGDELSRNRATPRSRAGHRPLGVAARRGVRNGNGRMELVAEHARRRVSSNELFDALTAAYHGFQLIEDAVTLSAANVREETRSLCADIVGDVAVAQSPA
jgi:hypothetical protein